MRQEHQLNYRMEKLEGDTHKLFLYDEISSVGDFDWSTWEYKDSETSAKHVQELLDEIPSNSTIEVHLNSRGGEVGEGTAIYNLLRQKSSQDDCLIIGYVDGCAYSIAMTIAMACDEIHMGLGTSMFLHNPWTLAIGDAEELRAEAERMDALTLASRQLYMSRAKNITEDEIREMMDKETMLDPESCLKYGFCDVIDKYDAQEKQPAESVRTLPDAEDVMELKRQLKEQAFTRKEVAKMLGGLKTAPTEPEQGEPEQEKPEKAPDEHISTIKDTLIAAMLQQK